MELASKVIFGLFCRIVFGLVVRFYTRLNYSKQYLTLTMVADIPKAISLPGSVWDLGKRAVPRVEASRPFPLVGGRG